MKWQLLFFFSFLTGSLLANRSDTYLKKNQDIHPIIQKGCHEYFSGKVESAGEVFSSAIDSFSVQRRDSLLAVANMA